jgi:hypothetical protein
MAIAGQKLAPWLGDRVLAHEAVEGQQIQSFPIEPRPGNLFAPVSGDHGARGRFGLGAHGRSPELWLTTHRGWLAAAAALAMAGALAWARRRSTRG